MKAPDTATTDRAEHAEVELLLPWYANGTLEAEEYARVERHLESCEDCEQALSGWHQIAVRVGEEEVAWTPPDGHLEQLMASFGKTNGHSHEPPSLQWRWPKWLGVVSGSARNLLTGWRFTPAYARWAMAGQTALVIALGVMLLARAPADAEYVTLTTPAGGAGEPGMPALRGIQGVQIVFAADLRHDQLSELLHSAGAQIVEGPSRLGVYKLALPAPDRLEQALAQLRQHPGVEVAEPVEIHSAKRDQH